MNLWKNKSTCLLIAFCLLFIAVVPAYAWETDITPENVFDMEESLWAEEQMNQLVRMGIVRGYEKEVLGDDGEYYYEYYLKPNQKITRAEFATMLSKALGFSESFATAPFDDTEQHWAAGYINALYEHDIIKGYSDNTFRPQANITRGEIVTMLTKSLNNQDPVTGKTDFTDVKSKKDHWSYDFIQKAVSMGIITGYQDGSFRPAGLATRAEVMTMLVHFLNKDLTTAVPDEDLLAIAFDYQKTVEGILNSPPDLENEEGPYNWAPAYNFITGSEVVSLEELSFGMDLLALIGSEVKLEYLELATGEVISKSDHTAVVRQYGKLHMTIDGIEETYEGYFLTHLMNENGKWLVYWNTEEEQPEPTIE